MFLDLFKVTKPIIGMVHLPPLPGSPNWNSDLRNLIDNVSKDIEMLTSGGVSGLLFENFGDIPFPKNNVTPLTVSIMTKVISDCTIGIKLPFGINVLRNDWEAAMSIAATTSAAFIRINILSGVYATDQGIIEGSAYQCLRLRKQIEQELGTKIYILADVNVKHGTPLHIQSLKDITQDLVERIGPDGLIVTGIRTGTPAEIEDVKLVSQIAGEIPVIVGSGINPDNISDYLDYANGFIVGTYLKKDGDFKNPVDPARVARLIEKP